MKIALITTTINVPTVLSLYRKYGPDVRFFVVGDEKTPHNECAVLCAALENAVYFAPFQQEDWKCFKLIPQNCIQRRNIALLEAVKWGADIIVSIDDDNIPLNEEYFWDYCKLFIGGPHFSGLKASSPTGWFDVGTLLQPKAPHRGFPHDKQATPCFEAVVDARIGVAAGICLGDPDISAVTRIANAPTVHNVSELLQSGIVVDPRNTWTVFNTQNTAFIRDLAPAMFCPPGVGRYDDIYASMITQRVMREKNLHVHFGKPFVWQQRNQHNLVKDLRAEIDGMENIVKLAAWLDDFVFEPTIDSVLDQTRSIYANTSRLLWYPVPARQAALAFLDDLEKVL